MVAPASRKEVLGEYGPAMRALPNHRWRAFVEFYLLENPGRGAQTNAARRAGFKFSVRMMCNKLGVDDVEARGCAGDVNAFTVVRDG